MGTAIEKQRPICYGYGRHSTAKQEFTRAAQRAKVKEYWRQHLRPKGIRWGGFYYDKAVQGSVEFSEREQGRQLYALVRPGDHVRRFVVYEEERALIEIIHELRQQGMAIEQIVLWLMRQTDYPNKRRLDNKAVEWAIAAKELGFPKQTDGKRMVKAWRATQRA